MRVRIRRSSKHNDRIDARRRDPRRGRRIPHGGAPPAPGHGARFGRGDDHEQLADAEGLDVDDVGGPGVGGSELANVEEDGFWVVAGGLGRGGGAEERRDETPDGVGGGGARVALGEVEGARAVRGAGGEGVAEGGGAGLREGAVGEGEGAVAHVGVVVDGGDGGAEDGREGGGGVLGGGLAGKGKGGWGVAYEEGFGAGELATADLEAARDAEVEFLERRSPAMARLRLAVGAGARLEAAHLPGAVVAVSTKNIRRRVSHGGLREARHETVRRLRISLDRLLKQNGRDALVVAADVRVVAQHRRPVDREPRQHADALAVQRPLEPQQRERLVDVVGVLGALLGRVGEVRPGAAVEVGVGDDGGAEVEEALVSLALD